MKYMYHPVNSGKLCSKFVPPGKFRQFNGLNAVQYVYRFKGLKHVARVFFPLCQGPYKFPGNPSRWFFHPVGHAWHVHMGGTRKRTPTQFFSSLRFDPYYHGTRNTSPTEATEEATAQHEQEQQVSPARAQTSPARARAQTAGGRTRGHTTGPGVLRLVGGGRGTGGHKRVASLDPKQIRLFTLKTRARHGFRLALKQTRRELWVTVTRPGDENSIPNIDNNSANCIQVITIPVLW